MNTLEYVKHRRKQKCKLPKPKPLSKRHHELGRILSHVITDREKMEANKADLMILPSQDQEFIF